MVRPDEEGTFSPPPEPAIEASFKSITPDPCRGVALTSAPARLGAAQPAARTLANLQTPKACAARKGARSTRGKGQYTRTEAVAMQNGQNRHAKTVGALHIVTLTDEDNQYGLVPYLAGRIRGEHGAEKLYADEDGPDGKTPSPRRKREAAETRGGERGRREKSNKTEAVISASRTAS